MIKFVDLKGMIENWLKEREYSYSLLNDPEKIFHFMIKNVGPIKMVIEIIQEKPNSRITIGFITFLSRDLMFTLAKFSQNEINNFKRKIDEFLPTLKVDYRLGYEVDYRIIEEKGNYGGQFQVEVSPENFKKETFFRIIKVIEETGMKVDQFLGKEIKNNHNNSSRK